MSHVIASKFSVVLSVAALSLIGCGVAVDDGGEGSASAKLEGTSEATAPYECPAYFPYAGQACSGEYACDIATDCSTIATATCSGGTWSLSNPSGCGPSDTSVSAPGTMASCPTNAVPVVGTYCGKEGMQCPYANSCGGADTYGCTDSAWTFIGAACAIESCPATAPTAGAKCTNRGLTCGYKGGKTATCDGTQWTYPTKTTTTSKRR